VRSPPLFLNGKKERIFPHTPGIAPGKFLNSPALLILSLKTNLSIFYQTKIVPTWTASMYFRKKGEYILDFR
jgi:hypothetical protein